MRVLLKVSVYSLLMFGVCSLHAADSVRAPQEGPMPHGDTSPQSLESGGEPVLTEVDRQGNTGLQVYFSSDFNSLAHNSLRVETRVYNTNSVSRNLNFECYTNGAWHLIGYVNAFHSTNYNENDNVLVGHSLITPYSHPTGQGTYLCGFGGDSSYHGYNTGQASSGGVVARYGVERSATPWTHFRFSSSPTGSPSSTRTVVRVYGVN